MNKNLEKVRSILHLLDRPRYIVHSEEKPNPRGPWDLVNNPYDPEISKEHSKARHEIVSALLGRSATEQESSLNNLENMLCDMLDLDHHWQIAYKIERMRNGLA